MKQGLINVTNDVIFKQSFGGRMIEDSEYSNPTKYGYPLKLTSVKVIDLTSLANFDDYLKTLELELEKYKKSRGKYRKMNIERTQEEIDKIKKKSLKIYIAYFKIQYKNKLFGQGKVK